MDTSTFLFSLPASLSISTTATATEPYLLITEQPVENFRFRYQSEMHGTHGQLLGRKKPNQKKTFPTVELRNYTGKAEIVCLLYQVNKNGPGPVHSHKLVVKQNDREISDPHIMKVSAQNGYASVFQGMGIIHTVQKHSAEELLRKKIDEYEYGMSVKASEDVVRQFRTEANKEAKSINLNQVALCFKAYSTDDGGRREICPPVFSTPINNMSKCKS
jgi:nuclear factor NF-kappa-B p105 subunit